jgi:hypothetical protein
MRPIFIPAAKLIVVICRDNWQGHDGRIWDELD